MLQPDSEQKDQQKAQSAAQEKAPDPVIVDNRQALATLDETGKTYWNLRQIDSPMAFRAIGSTSATPWEDTQAGPGENQALSYMNLVSRLESLDPLLVAASARLRMNTLKQLISQHALALECREYRNPFVPASNAYDRILQTLASQQPISSIDQAHDYIDQLELVLPFLQRWQTQIRLVAEHDVAITDSSRIHTLHTLQQELSRAPFNAGNEQASMIWQDFLQKLTSLQLYPKSQAILEDRARKILIDQIQPALETLASLIDEQVISNGNIVAISAASEQCFISTLNQWSPTIGYRSSDWFTPAKRQLDHLTQQIRLQLSFLPEQTFASQLGKWKSKHAQTPGDIANVQARLQGISERLPSYYAELPKATLAIETTPEHLAEVSVYRFIDKPMTQALEQENLGTTALLDSETDSQVDSQTDNQTQENERSEHAASTTQGLYQYGTEAANWPVTLYASSLPGKHLQYAMAAEQTNLPEWLNSPQVHGYNKAWPVYASEMATRMNAYASAEEAGWLLIQRLNLTLDLVLDSGLHSGQLTADQALETCMNLSGDDEAHCTNRLIAIADEPGATSQPALELMAFDQMLSALKPASTFSLLSHSTQADAALDLDRFMTSPKASMSVQENARMFSAFLNQGALPAPLFKDWLSYWQANPDQPLYP